MIVALLKRLSLIKYAAVMIISLSPSSFFFCQGFVYATMAFPQHDSDEKKKKEKAKEGKKTAIMTEGPG